MALLAELKRRNVPHAALLYIGATWALAQGIAQLSPPFGLPDWITRWFVIAAAVGFPFWIAFSWYYEITPEEIKRERASGESITRQTGRKMDFWIFGLLVSVR
ncbi:MAG TPA: hypothetical protein VHC92_06915 [Rhodanobacteraceae bacterium]|jgi:hypothetical protein|nr:hypothetical protein [Rhodanobacteraceae bacterium]